MPGGSGAKGTPSASDVSRTLKRLTPAHIGALRSVASGGWRVGCMLDGVETASPDTWLAVASSAAGSAGAADVALVVMEQGVGAPLFVNRARLADHLRDAAALSLYTTAGNAPVGPQRTAEVLQEFRSRLLPMLEDGRPVVSVTVKMNVRAALIALLLGYPVSWLGKGRPQGVTLHTVEHPASQGGFAFSAPEAVPLEGVLPLYLAQPLGGGLLAVSSQAVDPHIALAL